jgi:hypothetical protein
VIDQKCYECERTREEVRLSKCPICFKFYCDEHSFDMSGRTFCSNGCAEYFFFSEEDTEQEEG